MNSYATKAAQKADLDKLAMEWDALREANADELTELCLKAARGEKGEFNPFSALQAFAHFPSYLHNYRAERHAHHWVDASRKERAAELVELRALIKATPIVPVGKQIDPIVQAEERATKAMRDNGFRTTDAHAQWVYCGNWHGTRWVRTDWYLHNVRTAFIKVAAHIGQQMEAWEAAGSPNMAEWSRDAIRDFHAKHAA